MAKLTSPVGLPEKAELPLKLVLPRAVIERLMVRATREQLRDPGGVGAGCSGARGTTRGGGATPHRGLTTESSTGVCEGAALREAGLVRTAEDALTVLRQASQPLGPMGAEWLQRQERNL